MGYGKDLIKQLAEPIRALDDKVAELKADRSKQTELIEKYRDSLNIADVTKSIQAEQEIEAIDRVLLKLEQRKNGLIDTNSSENQKKAMAIINAVKREARESKAEENRLIKQKVDEIRAIYAEIKKADTQITTELLTFIDEIEPYLSKKQEPSFGAIGTSAGWLRNAVDSYNRATMLSHIDLYVEHTDNISGLIPPKK